MSRRRPRAASVRTRPATALTACLLLLLAPLVAAPTWAGGGAPTAATASSDVAGADVVRHPGPRSGVVTDLRRALRAADRGRPIPPGARPARPDLVQDTRTLPSVCTADVGEDRHRLCARGRTGSSRTVVVLGNSHMAMWLAGLEEEADRLGVRLVPFIKYGCVPYTFEMWRDGAPWPECGSWRDWALRRIAQVQPDLVVAAGHTWLELEGPNGGQLPRGALWNRTWREGVEGLSRRLGRSAGRVVVLGDTLTRVDNPGECVRRPGASMRTCEARMSARTRQLLRLTRAGAADGGAELLDMNTFTCLDGRCPVVSGGAYVFRDKYGHLTATYARQVRRAFARSLAITR